MADTDQEPIDTTPEEQQVRDKQLLETLGREAELNALKALLTQEPMRDFLWRLLTRCHLYGSIFKTNFGEMCHAEGERNLGLWLLSEIGEADPNAEMLMRQKSLAIAHAMTREDREKRMRAGRRKT